MNWKALVARNLNHHFKSEGLLKVTFSHVCYKCGSISETVPDRTRCSRSYCRPLIGSDYGISNGGNSDELE